MNKTNESKKPVGETVVHPQASPLSNEVFIRVGTTLYKVVDQPTIS